MKQELETQSLKPLFLAGGVSYAGVFGSFARGEATESSDVDIFIRLEDSMSLLELVRFERDLSEKIGRPVDLITEDALSPFMKDEVMRDMKTIYEKG
jgi:predicted nucleotidyltransferase